MNKLRVYWYAFLYFVGIWKMPQRIEADGTEPQRVPIKPKYHYATEELVVGESDALRFLEAAIVSNPHESLEAFLERHADDAGVIKFAHRHSELMEEASEVDRSNINTLFDQLKNSPECAVFKQSKYFTELQSLGYRPANRALIDRKMSYLLRTV
jgi:hypothetical protein